MPPLRNFLLVFLVLSMLGTALRAQSPIHAWGYFDASVMPLKTDEQRHNSGRLGFTVTLAKTGWGVGFARQRVYYASAERAIVHSPTTGWFASAGYVEDAPDDRLTVNSVLAIKEFNTANSDIRLSIEAGPSFVRYERAVLQRSEPSPGYVEEHFGKSIRSCTGADVRLRCTIAFSNSIALDGGINVEMNSIRSYGSFGLGLAVGLVRQPR